jgi:hypothetical protein
MSDVQRDIRIITDFLTQGLDKYEFENTDDIVMTISGLRGAREFQLALDVYKKYKKNLEVSDPYIRELTNKKDKQ